MKINPDKCHLLLSGNEDRLLNIGNYVIKISQAEKLQGVSIDRKLYVILKIYVRKLVEYCRL